jgi:hypothetical protein
MKEILFFLSLTIFSQNTNSWVRHDTTHFTIFYEGNWQLPFVSMELERLYNLMNMNLSYFAPWMKNEKTNIYIYSSYETYINGEFKPPKWSKGLAFWDKKTIVVYNDNKKKNLFPTIAHELTHLYFESFFATKLKHPPIWLNEGLAVYIEDKSYDGESLWDKALRYSPKTSFMKFASFFKTEVNSLKSDDEIANWYLQAYGIVRYLKETYSNVSFYKFCTDILNNEDIEKSIWKNFRISDVYDFERKWFYWIDNIKIRNEKKLEFKPFKKIEY